MDAMYEMGLQIHAVSVIVLVAIVIFNLVMLASSRQVIRYAKRMRIVMPISVSFIAVIIFTGAIMMAAKHLEFTLANIAMILLSIVMIVLEAKRYSILKRKTDIEDPNALSLYKTKAYKILGVELISLSLMSGWMMI